MCPGLSSAHTHRFALIAGSEEAPNTRYLLQACHVGLQLLLLAPCLHTNVQLLGCCSITPSVYQLSIQVHAARERGTTSQQVQTAAVLKVLHTLVLVVYLDCQHMLHTFQLSGCTQLALPTFHRRQYGAYCLLVLALVRCFCSSASCFRSDALQPLQQMVPTLVNKRVDHDGWMR